MKTILKFCLEKLKTGLVRLKVGPKTTDPRQVPIDPDPGPRNRQKESSTSKKLQ